MKLIVHQDAHSFLAAAEKFLLQTEIENCVLLGAALRMARRARESDNGTYFASVVQHKKTVAAAIWQPSNFVLLTRAPSEAIALLADDMQGRALRLPGVSAQATEARLFAERWSATSGAAIEQDYTLRMYQLEKVIHAPTVAGKLRLAQPADAPITGTWALAFDGEVDFGNPEQIKWLVLSALEEKRLYVWENGEVVSMLLHNSPTPHSDRVSVVYTPPAQRGKGYGAAANAALAQIILDSGKHYACLFADADNPISNKMYLRIGYQPVCDVHRYKFIARSQSA
jgi:uncharacterized protein